ncbi:Hypothetical predicted protein, partial [Mytilus galloprovincialis]
DDQSIHEIDVKDTGENSCGDRSDDEDQNDKWNFYDQHESTRAQSTQKVNTRESCCSDSSEDDEQNDKWIVYEHIVATSVSIGEQVNESDEVILNETHSIKKESSLDTETFEDEILRDVGLDNIKKEVLQMLKTDGPRNTIHYMNDNASMWKHATVKIAVAGKSSVGKSAFINAIRNVKSTDDGSAEEGLGDTTLVVQEYKHPKNKEIIYCDLPGYGTVIMTRETFLEKVNLLEYDLFFIFIDPVPTEDDQWLIEQLRKADKEFCFVKAKLDQDMKNLKRMGMTAENALAKIKKPIVDATKTMPTIHGDVNIFLISNTNFSIGEMVKLVSFIKAKVPKLKFEAIAFCLSSFAKEVIEMKYETLQKRISPLALSLSLSDDSMLNVVRAENELGLYYDVFGLDIALNQQPPNLRHPFSPDCIGTLLNSLCDEPLGVLTKMVPIYSTVVAYRSFKKFFKQLLDELKDDCLTVHKYAISKRQKELSLPKC